MISKAKPPTKAEQKRMDALRELGCIACRIEGTHEMDSWQGTCDIHHFLSGNKRLGHWATVPLCPPHHTGPLGWHKNRRQFREVYGSDIDLLVYADRILEKGK